VKLRRLAWFSLIGVSLVLAVMPLYWMLVASLTPGTNQLAAGNPWWPDSVTLDHYLDAITSPNFGRLMLNTAIVTLATLLVGLLASLLAAVALAYLRMPFSRTVAVSLFASYMLPQGVLFVPFVLMLSRLHLTNTLLALIVIYPSLVIPFGTWVLWTFLRQLPGDYLDLARLEGAGPVGILRHVLIPLAVPALAAVSLFAVAVVFNDALYTFTVVTSPQTMTLMADVGSTLLDIADPGITFAEILVGMVPVAFLCAWFADTYARGLGTGIIETG